MNVLDFAQKYGVYKKVSPNKGGEYHGPCPMCGGNDRFHIWPAQKVTGDWWCRGCDKGGDLIQWFIDVERMSFPEACKAVGRELPEMKEGQTPQIKRPTGDNWQPTAPAAPADAWREHAEKFVDFAHEHLLALGEESGSPLHYLAARGIRKETAIEHRLGWNPGEKGKDLYRAREAWGLETLMKGDKKKKLWLPIGLVIPYYAEGELRRVRIRIPNDRRTPDFSTPYYVVPGSSMDTYVINPTAKAFFIIEAELDALLVAQETAGLEVGAMALGNNSAKPTDAAYALLTRALHIPVALDHDLQEGSNKNPGGVSWLWWKNHFVEAERHPVPIGKDPGDAFKAGCNIREWALEGLPPIFNLPPAPQAKKGGARVNFDCDKMMQLLSDARGRVTLACPSGAQDWIEESRPQIWQHLKNVDKAVDAAFEMRDEAAFIKALESWEKYHMTAWQRYEERPKVIACCRQEAGSGGDCVCCGACTEISEEDTSAEKGETDV